MKLNKEFDFNQYLKDNIKGYSGKYSEYITLIPALYKLLCDLLESDDLPKKIRPDIYLTMGYLYYPNDLYSEEEHGPLGFLDDLMLILVVLRKCSIQEDAGIEFIKQFTGELNYSIDQLLTADYDKITKENKVLFEDLLTVSGMRFYYKDY